MANKLKKKRIYLHELFNFNWDGFHDLIPNVNFVDILTSIGRPSELVWYLSKSKLDEILKNRNLFWKGDFQSDPRYLSE